MTLWIKSTPLVDHDFFGVIIFKGYTFVSKACNLNAKWESYLQAHKVGGLLTLQEIDNFRSFIPNSWEKGSFHFNPYKVYSL
jgi:hypothetical protein